MTKENRTYLVMLLITIVAYAAVVWRIWSLS